MLYLYRSLNAEVAEWQTQQTQNLPRATSCGFDSRLRHQEKKLWLTFRHKERAPIKKGSFFYGIKEHTNLGASVCEQQTSINAVCDAMADAADSKSAEGNFMWVRLPPPAPEAKTAFLLVFAFFEKQKLRPDICFRLSRPNATLITLRVGRDLKQ